MTVALNVGGDKKTKDEYVEIPEELSWKAPIYPLSFEPEPPRRKFFSLSFFLISFFLTLCLILGSLQFRRLDISAAVNQKKFEEFIVKFKRTYSSEAERSYRYGIFKQNLLEIEESRKKYPGVHFDVNKFTDRTDEELPRLLISGVSEDFEDLLVFNKTLYSAGFQRPDYIDWRNQGKVMHVKDQGQCGSCWAFASVSAVESQYAIKKGTLWSLSEQELVDCESNSYGCGGGYMNYAMDFVKKNGLETEDDYPYIENQHDQCLLKPEPTRIYIDTWERLSSNEDDIANWVATRGPVTFGMRVVKSFYSYADYGIFHPSASDCDSTQLGNHAMSIIGYGSENNVPFWIIKNSWGTGWGDSGYMRIARGSNVCGIANFVVGPVIN